MKAKIVVLSQKIDNWGCSEKITESEHSTIKEANKEARRLARVIRDGRSCSNIKSWYNIWVEKQIFDDNDDFVESDTPKSAISISVEGII